jgi:hypothetical protein
MSCPMNVRSRPEQPTSDHTPPELQVQPRELQTLDFRITPVVGVAAAPDIARTTLTPGVHNQGVQAHRCVGFPENSPK